MAGKKKCRFSVAKRMETGKPLKLQHAFHRLRFTPRLAKANCVLLHVEEWGKMLKAHCRSVVLFQNTDAKNGCIFSEYYGE